MLDFFDYWKQQNNDIEPLFIIKYPVGQLGEELTKRKWKYKELNYSAWTGPKLSHQPSDLMRNATRNTKAVLDIEEIIQDFKPDVVMTNTIVCPWASFAAKLQGLPHIWFVREYGDIDHGHIFELGREETFADIGLMSELVVTNSLALTKYVSQYISADKIATLYTPFKIEKMVERSKENIGSPFTPEADLKAAMTGVLRPSKGQEQAIKAISNLKKKGVKAELCLIGHSSEPAYTTKLKKLAKKLNVGNEIHFVGKQSNPYAFIRYADVGIMASRMEAFGRVTFEYLCLGKPVVGAASGGTLEMIKDGKNGLLYETNNIKQLTDKLLVYAKNKDTLKEHQKAAANSATHMIHGESGAKALIKRINEVLAQKDIYRLPNFTRSWLNIPTLTRHAVLPNGGTLHKLKTARILGIKGTQHEVKKRLKSRIKRIIRPDGK